jgi:hypothetical protein
VQAIGEGRRSRQAALAAVHADLTMGEVAAARHAIGTFRYTQDGGRRPGRVLDEDAMRAYFVILWALERADNTLSCYSSGNQRRASGFIGWNLDELTRNVVWFRREHGARLHLDDAESWTRFRHTLSIRHGLALDAPSSRMIIGMRPDTASGSRVAAPRRRPVRCPWRDSNPQPFP